MKKFLHNLLFPTLFTSIFSGYGKIMVAVPIILNIKKNGKIATLLLAGSINSIANANRGHLYIINHSSLIPGPGSFMAVYHLDGATNGGSDTFDHLYSEFELYPLNIYSHIYNSDIKLRVDARDSNYTTNPQDPNTFINIELYNKGFQGTTNNSLEFVISKKYNFNFDWKNIFFKINQDIFDIKYLINNGEFDSYYDTNVGKIELGELDGSRTGVYNTGNVEFFNHADLNRDRRVDGKDLEIFAQNWGRDERAEPNDPNNTLGAYVGKEPNDLDAYSDINRDRVVDFKDFAIFAGKWFYDADAEN